MFIGRKQEIVLLRKKNHRDSAELMVIYGRRRVGKTALVEEAFKDRILWKFEGIEGLSTSEQIRFFLSQLKIYSGEEKLANANDWTAAFRLLASTSAKKNIVIFFDEFQWMAGMDEAFVSLFKYAWDNFFQKLKNCSFVICGSISSFIVNKVLRSRALYGRVHRDIHLQPLSLKESSQLLKNLPPTEVLDWAMTIGGIPKYLLAIDTALSYQQNLNALAFSQNGFFFQEFPRLLISHFASTPHYQKILETLSSGSQTLEALAEKCGISKGGSFSEIVDDLALADFITKEQPVDKGAASKILRYKISDEYLHFYFNFILPRIPTIQKGQWTYQTIPARDLAQWQGYAFERLCHKQAPAIAESLGFSGIQYQYGPWFRHQKPGAQIDLLFQRKDAMLTLCEAKYATSLTSRVIQECEKKENVLKEIFPNQRIQKVLVVPKKTKRSPAITRFFDRVLIAEEVFF